MRLRGIHDGELPTPHRIELIRVDLVHHLDEGIAVGDQQAGLAIGREIHVAQLKRTAKGTGDRLLAEMLHVKGRLALALRHLHAGIERPERHHVTQAQHHLVIRQASGPGSDGIPLPVHDADDGVGEVLDLLWVHIDRRSPHAARRGYLNIAKIRRTTMAHRRLWYMER